jgi:hypothetical protein
LRGGSGDVIDMPVDPFVPEAEGEEEQIIQKEGVLYKYALAIPYEAVSARLLSFGKFSNYEKTEKGFGIVYLNRRATAVEATTFSLYPLEPTNKTMISDTLSLLSENEKIKFSQDLKKRVAAGESNVEIALFISELIGSKILSLKNIYGYNADDFDFIGQLFRDYSEGKVEDVILPVRQIEDVEVVELPLTFDTAQDFVINLLAKTK